MQSGTNLQTMFPFNHESTETHLMAESFRRWVWDPSYIIDRGLPLTLRLNGTIQTHRTEPFLFHVSAMALRTFIAVP